MLFVEMEKLKFQIGIEAKVDYSHLDSPLLEPRLLPNETQYKATAANLTNPSQYNSTKSQANSSMQQIFFPQNPFQSVPSDVIFLTFILRVCSYLAIFQDM